MNYVHLTGVNIGVVVMSGLYYAFTHFGFDPIFAGAEVVLYGAIFGLAFALDYDSGEDDEED